MILGYPHASSRIRTNDFSTYCLVFMLISMGFLGNSFAQNESGPLKNTQLPKRVLPADSVGALFNDGPRTVYFQSPDADPIEKLFWDRELRIEKTEEPNVVDENTAVTLKSVGTTKTDVTPLVDINAQSQPQITESGLNSQKTEAIQNSGVERSSETQVTIPIDTKSSSSLTVRKAAGIAPKSAIWPVQVKPKNVYGKLDSQGQPWRGLVFEVPVSSPVMAIEGGRVMFADYFKNYGNLIIVSHGDKLVSVYTNNQKLLKKEGDLVARGDVVAFSGDSGNLNYPALYFEMRKDGKTIDPIVFLERI